jgi:hypothetical protein
VFQRLANFSVYVYLKKIHKLVTQIKSVNHLIPIYEVDSFRFR